MSPKPLRRLENLSLELEMEQTQRETKATKSSSSSSSSPPWLDLPDPLTELILERLPLLYYLRFAAVCRKWRSIQKSHRLRYSPSAPPMAPSLPLLIATDLHLEDPASIPNCYSPFHQTLHRLRLPSSLPPHDFVTSSHGWILLLHKSTGSQRTPSLLNPVTGAHILLPPLVTDMCPHVGAISAPPSDPHCAILIVGQTSFLYRRAPGSNQWNRLDFPPLPQLAEYIQNAVFHCAGRFYCMCDEGSEMLMHVLDPSLPAPSMQVIEMGDSWEYPYTTLGCYLFQELNGEILMLVEELSGVKFEDFHLFRADLSRKIWVSIEGIGRRALFVDDTSGFSLLSATVGCHNNCIYLAPGFLKFDIDAHFHEPWRMLEIFDLETMSFISEQQAPDSSTKQVLLQFDRNRLRWFVPSL